MKNINDTRLERIAVLRSTLAGLCAPGDRQQRDTRLWSKLAEVQDYLFDLSPRNLCRVRLHSHLFTLFNPVIYWHAPPGVRPESYPEVDLYRFYADSIPPGLHLSEPGISDDVQPLGIVWDGKVINRDIMRFQSYVSNLHTSGVLGWLAEQQHPLIVEVGGGFGGFALAMHRILDGNCTYIIVDLPETLLLSGCYLLANLPDARVEVVCSEADMENLSTAAELPDVVLVPNQFMDNLTALPECDLFISTASMQEMTPGTIRAYCEFGRSRCRGYFFSANTERHPHNFELGAESLSDLLVDYFELFPGRDLYDKLPDGAFPWFHRIYLGQGPVSRAPRPEGTIRFTGGNGGTGQRYRVPLQRSAPALNAG